jgi:hypothetical protein
MGLMEWSSSWRILTVLDNLEDSIVGVGDALLREMKQQDGGIREKVGGREDGGLEALELGRHERKISWNLLALSWRSLTRSPEVARQPAQVWWPFAAFCLWS